MTIGTEEARVWLMEVDAPSPALVTSWRACLDASELARADRFYFEADRVIYTAAHWLLRTALAEIGGLPPSAWRFVSGQHGKPALDPQFGAQDIDFNLSHTKGLVACACACAVGTEIGIDVERMTMRRAGIDIAEHYFSPAEVALLRASPAERQMPTFFQLWTLKEALIKATGEGLERPLDSFSFALDRIAVTFHPDDPAEAARWSFLACNPTAHHALALALRAAPKPRRLPVSRLRILAGTEIETTPEVWKWRGR
jgi:4'-phosphopantetheinyl transferase